MGPDTIIWIVALCTGGWLINNWIRAKHGYALEDEWTGKTYKNDMGQTQDAERKIGLLTSENEQLNGKLSRLEERVAVLERIATDKSVRLADEIENLR